MTMNYRTPSEAAGEYQRAAERYDRLHMPRNAAAARLGVAESQEMDARIAAVLSVEREQKS